MHYFSQLRPSSVNNKLPILIMTIEKTSLKDYKFFLEQRNFLKVVDTLEKFEEGMLD